MKDQDKTKEKLVNELRELRQRIAELEAAEIEYERVEEALRESEERYRDIVELAPDGILTGDLKGVATSCNSAFLELTGFSRDEIVGTHISKFPTLRIQDIPKYADIIFSAIQGKITKPFEFKWVHKDGTERWGEAHLGLMKKGSKVIGLQFILRDTTERKQAEEALRKNEERLQLVFKDANLGLWDWNVQTGEVVFNDRWADMLGYTLDELEPHVRTWEELLHPDELNDVIEILNAHLEGKTDFYETEHRMRTKDGNWKWILDRGQVLEWDRQGKPLRAAGTHLDITERKRAEEALREREQFLQDVFDAIQDGISVLDTDLNVVITNRWMEQKYAHQMPLAGRKCYRVYQQLQTPCPWCPTLRTIKTGETHTETVPYPSADNPTGWIELSAFPIKDEVGRVTRVIEYVKDITEQKRAEEALQESEERFRRAVLESPFPTMLHAEDGEVITINEAWVEISGYTQDDISTIADWTEKAYGERKALVESGIDQLYSLDRRVDEGEYVITTSSGEERTWHFHSAPLGRLPDGRRLVLSIAADVTERKRAAEALRESEDRLSKTMLAANDGMWDWDLTTDEAYFDPRYYEMAGYEADEFPSRLDEFQKRVHPDDVEYVMGQAQKHLEGEIDRFVVEFRFRKKDGDWLWIMGRGVIVERDRDGVPLRFVGTHTDITERKRAEEALRESEEKFRTLINQTVDMLLLHDMDGKIIDVNRSSVEQYGYTREELLSMTLADLDPDYAKREDGGKFWNQFEPDDWFRFEARQKRKNGSIFPVEATISLVMLQGETCVMGLCRDITDRKRAEQEIHQRVRELTALNALGRRVGATLSLEQVVKAALEEIAEPVHPDLALLFLREGDELILQGVGPKGTPHAHQETPVHRVGACLCGLAVSERSALYVTDIHADPRCTWKECKEAGLRSFAALPMQSGDEIIGVLGLASAEERDFGAQDTFLEAMVAQITSGLQNAILHKQIQRHAEEMEQRVAERTAELAAKNRELETFTYSVSHDLKAPLRGIDGYSRLLLEDHSDQLDEEGRRFLRTIRRATARMHQLIEDLLTYSRLERRSLTLGRIDPQALIESLIAERAEEIEERGIHVTVDVLCAHIVTDAEGFTQALRNLLENALKFTRETPETQIEIGGRKTDKSCILWVRDNGIGFDMKYRDHIFKIFERLHREEDYPGTGVGLAIVHKAMARIGGRAWAESKQGEGATFYLEIPR